mmetsp:Transcript_16382/g.34641  ORF Transcript_16382/g.34641 Transcript_16382/m.34641 type:complete len:261 (-) Transcript_16382:1383-2165(-)
MALPLGLCEVQRGRFGFEGFRRGLLGGGEDRHGMLEQRVRSGMGEGGVRVAFFDELLVRSFLGSIVPRRRRRRIIVAFFGIRRRFPLLLPQLLLGARGNRPSLLPGQFLSQFGGQQLGIPPFHRVGHFSRGRRQRRDHGPVVLFHVDVRKGRQYLLLGRVIVQFQFRRIDPRGETLFDNLPGLAGPVVILSSGFGRPPAAALHHVDDARHSHALDDVSHLASAQVSRFLGERGLLSLLLPQGDVGSGGDEGDGTGFETLL